MYVGKYISGCTVVKFCVCVDFKSPPDMTDTTGCYLTYTNITIHDEGKVRIYDKENE